MADPLSAISPIDGRYKSKVSELDAYFSEFALIKYRIKVEIEYLILLAEHIPQIDAFSDVDKSKLRSLYEEFSIGDAKRVKSIEKVTNHDVKAVEYFIKENIDALVDPAVLEFVHFRANLSRH